MLFLSANANNLWFIRLKEYIEPELSFLKILALASQEIFKGNNLLLIKLTIYS